MQKLYCVQVRDKVSGGFLFMNFVASNQAPEPINEPTDRDFDRMVLDEVLNINHDIDRFRIQFQSSKLFESAESRHPGHVIMIWLNRAFAERIKDNPAKRHFVVSVCMSELQDSMNRSPNEFTGQRVDFDHANYRLLENKTFVQHTGGPL